MRRTEYKTLSETVFQERLDNGLTLFVLQKSGFRQTYANFCTRYGSIDMDFVVRDRGERVKVPEGVAHFLEHKLFEKEDIDAFTLFAKLGAQSNAYTTFDGTTYLFSNTSRVEESLLTLLDFVQNPYFSDESVEKEKGIIGQEIKMYEDNPSWQSYFGYLRALYGEFPLALDIAGTVESIAEITKEHLYDCYRTFYHPSNMILFVTGDADPQRVAELVRDNQSRKTVSAGDPIVRFYPPAPSRAASQQVETRLEVSQPRVIFGFKESVVLSEPTLRQRREAAMEVWMDGLLGAGSEFFHQLINDGLADQGFGSEYECTALYGYSLFGGNSDHPLELVDRVRGKVEELAETGLPEADFERTKRKAIGRFLGLLDSPQGVANLFTSQKLRGVDALASLDVLESLTLDEVNEALRSHVDQDQVALSVVWPHSV